MLKRTPAMTQDPTNRVALHQYGIVTRRSPGLGGDARSRVRSSRFAELSADYLETIPLFRRVLGIDEIPPPEAG